MAELGFQADISGVRAHEPTVGDFFALMKPRVMSLVVLTALTGMVAAPGSIHPVLGFIAKRYPGAKAAAEAKELLTKLEK